MVSSAYKYILVSAAELKARRFSWCLLRVPDASCPERYARLRALVLCHQRALLDRFSGSVTAALDDAVLPPSHFVTCDINHFSLFHTRQSHPRDYLTRALKRRLTHNLAESMTAFQHI